MYHKCIIVVLHNVDARASDTPQIRRDTTVIHVLRALFRPVSGRGAYVRVVSRLLILCTMHKYFEYFERSRAHPRRVRLNVSALARTPYSLLCLKKSDAFLCLRCVARAAAPTNVVMGSCPPRAARLKRHEASKCFSAYQYHSFYSLVLVDSTFRFLLFAS